MNGLLRLLTATLVILGLTACDTVDEKMIRDAQKLIAEQLKDPGTAKFSGVYIVREEPGTTDSDDTLKNVAVCGYVNGKNAFGAYAGATRFVVLFAEIEKSKSYSVIIAKMEGTSQPSKDATVESNKTSKPESVFDKIYWNKRCVDEVHPPVFSGVNW